MIHTVLKHFVIKKQNKTNKQTNKQTKTKQTNKRTKTKQTKQNKIKTKTSEFVVT